QDPEIFDRVELVKKGIGTQNYVGSPILQRRDKLLRVLRNIDAPEAKALLKKFGE
ncbi:MAG: hypothetical protein HRT89_10900, partial [Lentisphaeria bacterium]|nr:hypothetical protein [Lentisphaeria bacterium]